MASAGGTHNAGGGVRYGHSHSHSLTSSTPASIGFSSPGLSAPLATTASGISVPLSAGLPPRGTPFRASVDAASVLGSGGLGGSVGQRGTWGAATSPRRPRPSSELLPHGQTNGGGNGFQSAETEAIDRWFEDLQHYETTLEEMAAASLDTNFKEELSAIEQWFRVLSEAERTAALYSLLQSATHVQMRFFITVLQQMARNDPVAGGLMSPAALGQSTMEAQMEAKLAGLQLNKSLNGAPPSPSRFGRSSLGPGGTGESYLSPHSASLGPSSPGVDDTSPAAATLASQRAKLKTSARTSAPANLLLSSTNGDNGGGSALWSEREQIRERSPSPRPKSSSGGSDANGRTNGASQSLRSPGPTANDFDAQLSPMVGGSWASMVNTPLVPMFGKTNDGGTFGGLSSPSLDGTSARPTNENWRNPANNTNASSTDAPGNIVLDDVRKFRRSARISGEEITALNNIGNLPPPTQGAQQQQRRVSPSQLSNLSMQQNAINLGLGGLNRANGISNNGPASPGLISAQQAAVAAQNNWRNGLTSPNLPNQNMGHHGLDASPSFEQQFAAVNGNLGVGGMGAGAFTPQTAQLANLFALQQQVQLQQLNMAAAGMALSPVQMMGLQQQQQQLLSPGGRMMGMGGMPGMGMMGGMGMGMGGMASPRRSPRQNDRSPGGNNNTNNKSSVPVVAGSGANPDEPLDMHLLSDTAAWLRALRLHKYTPNFERTNWKELVMYDDATLEAKGVSALGARRKLLKVFETVRSKTGMAPPNEAALPLPSDASSRSVSPAVGSTTGDSPRDL